ncbi:hypothetical protein DB91_02855 [Ehrlichia sp. Wisconsin_h]|nr:hypothetical protein DB91_02855 [Ehrlichia sp. Wisconsin_h]
MSVICIERNIFLKRSFLIRTSNLSGFVAYVFIYVYGWNLDVCYRLDKIYCGDGFCNTCEGLLCC